MDTQTSTKIMALQRDLTALEQREDTLKKELEDVSFRIKLIKK